MPQIKSNYSVLCFGEILWDILRDAKLPGGAPMNVAYHLNKLGKNSAIISRIGLDELGKELFEILLSKNINTEFVQEDYEIETGKVYAEIGEHNEVHYDIVKPVAWDFIQWQDDFISLLEQAEYFVFGSLITRSEQSKNTLFRCLELAKSKVLDINLRPPHFNKKIVKELLSKADILKLNWAELHLITGWFSNYKSDEDRIKLLQEKFNIDTIIVTKGSEGAILYMHAQFYHHHGYVVDVADTVGSGDAFLAGIISKLIERAPPNEALEFASMLGAFIASCKGACPQYTLDAIHQTLLIHN